MIAIDAGLYPYQIEARDKMIARKGRGCLFMDRRTGKSRTALAVAHHFNDIHRVLIVSPISAVGDENSGWVKECKVFGDRFEVHDFATSGTVAQRSAQLSNLSPVPKKGIFDRLGIRTGSVENEGPIQVAIVSYSSYWRKPLNEAILKWRPDMVIYDEAHRIKGRSTKQSKFAHQLHDVVKYALALTGTFAATGAQDAFSIYKAVDDKVFGRRWSDFDGFYLLHGGFQMKQVIGLRPGARKDYEQRLQKSAYLITKAQAWEFMPKEMEQVVPVQLSSRRAYDEMRKESITEIIGVDPETGEAYTGLALARLTITARIRLQQMTSGFIRSDDGRLVDLSSEKLDALVDLLEDLLPEERKTVIFAMFRRDMDRLEERLQRAFKNTPLFRVDGTIDKKLRGGLQSSFIRSRDGIFICQMAATEGLDLSSAPSAIYYSLDQRLINYLQSHDRMHNPNRREPITYYYLLAEKTVDKKIYEALKNNEDAMKQIQEAVRSGRSIEDLI